MAMDTSTVRLVIFLGMFLVFAGDYTAVISAIFGNVHGKNDNVTTKRLQGPPRDDQGTDKLMSDKLVFDDESGISRNHSFHCIIIFFSYFFPRTQTQYTWSFFGFATFVIAWFLVNWIFIGSHSIVTSIRYLLRWTWLWHNFRDKKTNVTSIVCLFFSTIDLLNRNTLHWTFILFLVRSICLQVKFFFVFFLNQFLDF